MPCPLTHTAGADAVHSCWAKHTGVYGATGCSAGQIESQTGCGAGFKHVVGNVNVTQPNVTIDHEWISGCVAIQATATNFHLTDSLITSSSQDCQNTSSDSNPGVLVSGNDQNVPSGVVIQDSTIDAQSINLERNPVLNDFGVVLGAGGLALRDNILGYAKDLYVNGNPGAVTTVRDSYIHDPPAPANDTYDCDEGHYDPHSDPLWVDSSQYVTIEHDYISGAGGGDCVTAAVSFLSDWGAATNDTVENTFMEGGTAPGDGRPDAYFGKSGTCAVNTSVTNNAFSSDSMRGVPVTEWAAGNPGDAWSGNTTPETGAVVAEPNNC